MNSSASRASRVRQSVSLPGMPAPSRGDLRLVASRASRAATRAREACMAFVTTSRASVGFSSSHSANFSFVARSTRDRMEVLPSFALVCPSNWGSRSFTETMAHIPSRMSSPSRFSSFSFSTPLVRAYLLTTFVRPFFSPSTWVPPSTVAIPLAKPWRPSL